MEYFKEIKMFKTKQNKKQNNTNTLFLYYTFITIESMALRNTHFGYRGLAKRILPKKPSRKKLFYLSKFYHLTILKHVSFTRFQDHETVST